MDIVTEVQNERDNIERHRYQGRDLVVALPRSGQRARLVARLLAAERASALVQLNGDTFNPQEDLAVEAFEDAVQSARRRAYRAARVHLADASRFTFDHQLEQRLALWRLLLDISREVSYTAPSDPLSQEPVTGLRELLLKLDHLPQVEIEFYSAEAERLVRLHNDARTNASAAVLWTLSRAALAAYSDEKEAALLWELRAFNELSTLAPDQQPDEYLQDQQERAATRIRLLTELVSDEETAKPQSRGARANPYDFLDALCDRFGNLTGTDARPLINAYAPQMYMGEAR